MTADTTQPAGVLPEPKSIAAECGLPAPDGTLTIRLIGREVEIDAYRASTMVNFAERRAADLMAERDAARAQSERWAKSVDSLRDERDALRRELEELRAIPPDAREPLTPERVEEIWEECSDPDCAEISIHEFARAIEAAHRIGPAGTSTTKEN